MNCPECPGIKMRVTHTYGTKHGHTQRLVCPKCGLVGAAKTTIVVINPGWGQGAAAIARKMEKRGSDDKSKPH